MKKKKSIKAKKEEIRNRVRIKNKRKKHMNEIILLKSSNTELYKI